MRHWFQENAFPLQIYFGTRLWLFLVVYLSLIYFPPLDLPWRAYPDNLFLDGWIRWDSGWYFDIAEYGYDNLPMNDEGQRDTAYFPLYPLSAHLLKAVTKDAFLAGLLVSNAAFLVALPLFFQLVKGDFGEKVARRSVVLLSLFPFSFYFNAMYTESLFLLSGVTAFYFARRGKWHWAAVGAAAASATRVVGVVIVVGLAVAYLEEREFDWRRIRTDFLWIPLGASGLLAFMLFLGIQFGNSLQFYESVQVPGWVSKATLDLALQSIDSVTSWQRIATGNIAAMNLINIFTFFLALFLLIYTWFRVSKSYAIWALLALIMAAPGWHSMGRYVAVLFPIFISGALLLPTTWYRGAIYVSVMFLTLFSIMFSHFIWVA